MTSQQAKLLHFITAYRDRHDGATPSYAEMASAMCLHSKSGISRLLAALQERGHIRRLPGRARAIQIVDGTLGMLIEIGAFRKLGLYCQKTKAEPVAIISEAIDEYLAKRKFTA